MDKTMWGNQGLYWGITDLKETGLQDVYWIHMAQDREQWQILVNMIMNLRAVHTLKLSIRIYKIVQTNVAVAHVTSLHYSQSSNFIQAT
jgi:hypothetical protein